MSFFEEYLKRNVNFAEEVQNLYILITRGSRNSPALLQIAENYFLEWPLRGTAVTLHDFLKISGMGEIETKAHKNEEITLEQYLLMVEIVLSMVNYFYKKLNKYTIVPIYENVVKVLSKINYETVNVNFDNRTEYVKCIEKDVVLFEASEIINDNNLSEKIFMYRHYSLKGNVYEKAIILSRLYMYFEGIRNSLVQNGFTTLCKTIGELSDKLNVRHKPNAREELVIKEFNNKELEYAYDKLFDTYLSVIVLNRYIKDKDYLEKLRSKFVKI